MTLSIRTFIAVDLSEGIKNSVFEVQRELKKSGADIKWVDPKNLHVTLKFLGETDEEKVIKIKFALDEIASLQKSFEINISELGAFPNMRSPRIIWIGIDKGARELSRLALYIEEKLSSCGFEKEKKAFSSHITIGRARSTLNQIALKEKMPAISIPDVDACLINRVTLYKSTLSSSGPTYEALHLTSLKAI